MNSRWLLALILVLSNYAWAQQEVDGGAAQNVTPAVISVTTRPISEVLTQPEIRLSAEAVSLNHAQISAQATGEVMSIAVEVGDQAEKGQTLATLDCRQSQLNQAAAHDSLKLARKEYKRAQSLGKSQSIAEQQLNQAQSTLDQANISAQQTAIAVENCLIKAPFSGVVTDRQIQLGALASPGLPVLVLLQTDAIEVQLQVNNEQLHSLQNADNIQFIANNAAYRVKLRAVLPLVNSFNNKRLVRLQFVDQYPFAGSVGDVVWPLNTRVLPVDFIVQRDNQLGFFIVDDQVARFIPLANAQMGHPAVLEEALADPDQTMLIVQGRYRVEDGSQIKILN